MNNTFEGQNTEFKKNIDSKDWHTWLKTCCAFSNSTGGTFIIGIDDDGTKNGFPKSRLDDISLKFNSIVREHTYPVLAYEKEYVRIEESENYLININIKPNKNSTTWLISKDHNPIMYVRSDGQSIQANIEEMQRAFLNTAFKNFDETIVGVSFKDVSFNELNEIYMSQYNKEKITNNLLKSFSLIDANGKFLTLAGYLFCDNSDYINANAVCTTWPSNSKGSNEYSNTRTFKGSAIFLLKSVIEYIFNVPFYSFGGRKGELFREETGSFSSRALREAVINAIAHRDYTILGGQISIDCFPDRIEISSPGCILQRDFEVTNAKLETLVSQRRNRTICNVFCKCNLMEEKGSGFAKIIKDYENYSEIFSPTYSSTRNSFTLNIKNKKFKFENSSSVTNGETYNYDLLKANMFKTKEELFKNNEKFNLICQYLNENKFASYDELAKTFGMTRDGVKFYIKQLKESCLIRRVGTNVSGNYELVNDIDRPEEFLHLEEDVKDKVLKWCSEYFKKTDGFNNKHTSYGLKHILQRFDYTYLTNGAFKGAMLIAGFKVKDIQELNWVFNVSEKSHAFKIDERK